MILLLFHLQASMSVQKCFIYFLKLAGNKFFLKLMGVLDLFHKYELAILYNLNV